jgi:hypothetical protein
MAKKKETKGRPEHYEKSNLKINGTFEQVIKASFLGKPKEKPKEVNSNETDSD